MGQTLSSRRVSHSERSRETTSGEKGDTKEVSGLEIVDHIEKGKNLDYGNLDSKEPNLSFSSWGPCHFDKLMKLVKPEGNLVAGPEQEDERCSKTCVSHGSISVAGRQRALTDTVVVIPRAVDSGEYGSYDFFGVYDGHGRAKGAISSRDKMHEMLAKAVENKVSYGSKIIRGLKYWEEVMKLCFANMDHMELHGVVDRKVEMKATGSNAAVVLVGEEEIVVANSGDSCRVVLCQDGLAIPLSLDHKHGRHYKRERVEVADGQVLNWNVLKRDGICICGVSSTSRSKGHLKPHVISEPEVSVSNRTESDEFLVVATDGLWDVVSNEMACQVVRMCFAGLINRRFGDKFSESCSADAALMLVQLALDRGSQDNISVIVVELKKMNPNFLN